MFLIGGSRTLSPAQAIWVWFPEPRWTLFWHVDFRTEILVAICAVLWNISLSLRSLSV